MGSRLELETGRHCLSIPVHNRLEKIIMWIITQAGTRVNAAQWADYSIRNNEGKYTVAAENLSGDTVYTLFEGTQAECLVYQARLDSVLSVRTINAPIPEDVGLTIEPSL
jgi:hypothetical protein